MVSTPLTDRQNLDLPNAESFIGWIMSFAAKGGAEDNVNTDDTIVSLQVTNLFLVRAAKTHF